MNRGLQGAPSNLAKVATLVIAAAAAACTPPTIPSPSELRARTADPSAAPTPMPPTSPEVQPTEAPLTGLSAGALTTPDSIVVAWVEDWPSLEDESRDRWRLDLEVIPRTGPRLEGGYIIRPPDGWEPLRDYTMLKVSADGFAAMTIATRNGGVDNNTSTLVIDLVGDRGMAGPIRGSYPAWLPDGSLLLLVDTITDGIPVITANRILDHGFGEVAGLEFEDASPQYAYELVADADLTGVVGFRNGSSVVPQPVTIRWDGTIEPRDPLDVPLLVLGHERWTGAHGETTTGPGAMEDIPTRWHRPDGTVSRIPGFLSSQSWTRDGAALVVRGARLGVDGEIALVRDTPDGLKVEALANLPVLEAGTEGHIVGMTAWAALFEDPDGENGFVGTVTLIPLDGSPAIGPFTGVLAAVNP